jgi:hypothetical protein
MDKMTDLEITDSNYVISFELKCVDVYCPPPDFDPCKNEQPEDEGPWFVSPNNNCYCRKWKLIPVMR